MVRCATGLDRLAAGEAEVVALVRGRRVGLVAHPASVDARLTHAKDLLVRAGAELRVLFGPEHGYGGEAQDMIGVEELRDAETGALIRSLYGATEAELSPKREWLEGLDAIVIDLQDVGSRYYTFVWTAALMMRAAAAAGVETIVLDRPNPIGGAIVEGAPQRSGYRSFVGLYDVAVRHGMTIGEITLMVRELERLDERALRVVEMRGWTREMLFADTGLPWVLPSPNMPTAETALVYPGGCLLEGTSLSEGRGVTRPFEIWGAPALDGRALADAVRGPGAHLRPLTFQPTFHKHAKQICGGVQVHVTDPRELRSYELYLRAIAKAHELTRETFRWRTETYEYVTDRPAIDLLTGGPEYRAAVDRGEAAALDGVLAAETRGAAQFAADRRRWLRYA
jgi:uncharacterized protein YbbC (DUF1343 family)